MPSVGSTIVSGLAMMDIVMEMTCEGSTFYP
jgi:hypothetical protein